MPLRIENDADWLLIAESVAQNVKVICQLPAGEQPEGELTQLKSVLGDLSENSLTHLQARARRRLQRLVLLALERRLRDAAR